MGHRAETLFRVITAKKPGGGSPHASPEKKSHVFTINIPERRLRDIVHQEVSQAVQPVMETLARYEAKRISFSDIVGGVGWIVGLMGIWMIMKARGKK